MPCRASLRTRRAPGPARAPSRAGLPRTAPGADAQILHHQTAFVPPAVRASDVGMREVGWGPSPGRNPPPSPRASLPGSHPYFDVAEDTPGAGAGALGDVNWGFADFRVDSHGEGFPGSPELLGCAWAPAALRPVPAPAARTDCAEIPPRLRVNQAAGASSFYKSAPGSDDETLSPPSFASCAEGTLKPQEAEAERRWERGLGEPRTPREWGLWGCDSALPTRGDTPTRHCAHVPGCRTWLDNGTALAAGIFPQGKRLGF